MPDASPAKWHLAHTTWFFEAMVLSPHLKGYRPFDERFTFLFNSYYETLGARQPRPRRGMITRPALDEVYAYRAHVDEASPPSTAISVVYTPTGQTPPCTNSGRRRSGIIKSGHPNDNQPG
jgi:hypothetical protein